MPRHGDDDLDGVANQPDPDWRPDARDEHAHDDDACDQAQADPDRWVGVQRDPDVLEADAAAADAGPAGPRMTCPRRMEEFGPWERAEGLDEYEPGHGLVTQSRGCSFCGSLPPDDFMAHVRDGGMVGPTDKSYKAYVGEQDGKFYFQHLGDEQRAEFIELLNAGRVTIGYPGRFYVLPFFVARAGVDHA